MWFDGSLFSCLFFIDNSISNENFLFPLKASTVSVWGFFVTGCCSSFLYVL